MNEPQKWDEEDRLTLWTKPDEVLKSTYGHVTYQEWCERELQRITTNGGSARIVARDDGFIALFRQAGLPWRPARRALRERA